MNRKSYLFFAVIIVVAIIAAAVLYTFVFNPADKVTREALSKRCSFLAENIDLKSTAGRRQANIIRTLLESGKNIAAARIEVEYPFDEAVFPPEFIPPMFVWHDSLSGADTWLIDVTFPGGAHLTVLAPKNPLPDPVIDQQCFDFNDPDNPPYPPYKPPDTNWTPPDDVWKTIKALTTEKSAEITVYGFDSTFPDRVLSAGRVRIGTSRDPVGAPIFYRDVPMIGVRRVLADELAGVIQPLPIKAQELIM